MIRVLITDDSRVIREVVKDLLDGTDIQVVGEAVNGKEAIDKVKELKPDIVTMDVMMPVMDGLTAVEHIMAYTPTPILVLASSINRKDVNIAFEAIQLGALDVMEKPENLSREGFAGLRDTLVNKLRLLSGIRVISHLKGRRKKIDPDLTPPPSIAKPSAPPVAKPPPVAPRPVIATPAKPRPISSTAKSPFSILAIGASTGGPKAVMALLKSLPGNFPIAAMLVQHIGSSFTPGFVEWLDRECEIKVKLAEPGEKVQAGVVYVAPGDKHLEAKGESVILTDGAPEHSCKPSVDVMFRSVAREYGDKTLAVLLTGMGRDGAEGMLKIKNAKGSTIVQDEETCVIFGMPKAAIEVGAADKVMPLKDIGGEIIRLVGGENGKNTDR